MCDGLGPVASSIGSLGKESEESGVENVTVTGAALVGTENGLRIVWAGLAYKLWLKALAGLV